MQVNHAICYQTLAAPPAPPASERQAEWEQILHLKPGDLSPARVAIRRKLLHEAEARDIRAELAADDSQQEV